MAAKTALQPGYFVVRVSFSFRNPETGRTVKRPLFPIAVQATNLQEAKNTAREKVVGTYGENLIDITVEKGGSEALVEIRLPEQRRIKRPKPPKGAQKVEPTHDGPKVIKRKKKHLKGHEGPQTVTGIRDDAPLVNGHHFTYSVKHTPGGKRSLYRVDCTDCQTGISGGTREAAVTWRNKHATKKPGGANK